MNNIEKIKLNIDSTIKEALRAIDNGAMQIAAIVDKNNKLIGVITDGDIRRALLNSYTLEQNIEKIINKTPVTCNVNESREVLLNIALENNIKQIPLINDENEFIGIELVSELIKIDKKDNLVVIMAGGLGTRLYPLTKSMPKPMLKVGDKPILQIIIENFSKYGFKSFLITLNYKSEIIKKYFGNGKKFGINIKYIEEKERMGTVGALTLINNTPKKPFFLINGDLLTDVNFENVMNYHNNTNSIATMCVRNYSFDVPYGVINIDSRNKIKDITEKPKFHFKVNAGVYILNPELLNEIPKNTFYDITTLFDKVLNSKREISTFTINGYWMDIGQKNDFKRANKDYFEVFE